MSAWGLHFCPLDRDCREFGAPCRLYVHLPWGSLIIGFTLRAWTQVWLPWKTRVDWGAGRSNYSRWWSPVVWHPRSPDDDDDDDEVFELP